MEMTMDKRKRFAVIYDMIRACVDHHPDVGIICQKDIAEYIDEALMSYYPELPSAKILPFKKPATPDKR